MVHNYIMRNVVVCNGVVFVVRAFAHGGWDAAHVKAMCVQNRCGHSHRSQAHMENDVTDMVVGCVTVMCVCGLLSVFLCGMILNSLL